MGEVKNVRIVPLTGTDAGLSALNPIPNQSEIVIVKPPSGIGQYGIKIGDGVHNYAALPLFTSGGTGDYLGLAVTSTVPPTLAADAYYLTTVHGTFTNLSAVVVPATSLLSVISYDFAGGGWVASEILDTSAITAPTFDAVLGAGDTSNNKLAKWVDSASNICIAIVPSFKSSELYLATTTAGTFGVGMKVSETPGANSLAITWNGKLMQILADNITAAQNLQAPDESGTIVVHNTKTAVYNNNGTESAVLDAGNQQVGLCAPDNVTPWAVLSASAAYAGYLELAGNSSAGFTLFADTTDTSYRFFTMPKRGSAGNKQTVQLSGDQQNPTYTLGPGSGTGATLLFGTGSDDRSGTIQLTTGTLPTAAATIVTVFFSHAYPVTTRVLIQVFVVGTTVPLAAAIAVGSPSSFTISGTLNASLSYLITYIVQN